MSTTLDAEDHAGAAEQLIDDIEALENTRAPLYAVYGPGGTWEAERKCLLSACAVAYRMDAADEKRKVTEAAVNDLAHDHADYRTRIDLATEERTKMALLDAEIAAKTRRYELAKSRIYLSGRLAGLQ
jgi:hypothetical protein